MKYWKIKAAGNGLNEGISLSNGREDEHGMLSITPDGDYLDVREECDYYFSRQLSRSETIEALQEAIDWIKKLAT